jgi:hypothetical protein
MTAEELKQLLGLRPLPVEGGYFAETYRSGETIPAAALPARYGAVRSAGTAIYFLLTPDTFSALHRLKSDEIYHFYFGDAVELLMLRPDGSGEVVTLGTGLAAGERPQVIVPQGVWQGSRLRGSGRVALMGTTMSPGWDEADFELGTREKLAREFPKFREWIEALTRVNS